MGMTREQFRQLVRAQIGDKYVFGHEVDLAAKDPEVWDCSELVQWAFHKAGADIPDGSYNQFPKTVAVSRTAARIGDLVFWKDSRGTVYHVGILVGNGQVVEARGRDWGVVLSSVDGCIARGGILRRYKPIQAAFDKAGASAPPEVLEWFLQHGTAAETNAHEALSDKQGNVHKAAKTTRASHEHIAAAIAVVSKMDDATKRAAIMKAAGL